MLNAPVIDQEFARALSLKYFEATTVRDRTTDPLTDEPLDYAELVRDVVDAPTHGYSRFHIGHQDPRSHPKHLAGNVRWQLKASNDFQGTMDIRVARIAFTIDQFTRQRDPRLFEEATTALSALGQDFGLPVDT